MNETPTPTPTPTPAPEADAASVAGRRRLRFWVITIAAVATLAATASLGRWQLSRAAQKEALQAEIDAQKLLPPIDAAELLAMDKATAALHRPLTLRGLWLAPQTVYLDNRQMNGVPGFYVVTPLAIEGSQQTVMVQRGWVQRNFNDRTRLEPVETPAGLVEVTGLIVPPPAHLLSLGKDAPAPGAAVGPAPAADTAALAASAPGAADAPVTAPLAAASGLATPAGPGSVGSSPIRQNLDLDAFRAETGLPLRTDFSLQETGPASQGLQRNWPQPALGIEKHYGYAFQWFGLSALVVLLYVWFQLIAPWRKAARVRR
ncbi:SURF1 family protein [Variovorax ginsengisoli]|uniref:SURF1-like protein n=1 Tax=Variovorax ginsengisoli TaxID=363844 RepID=A0ABT9S8E2_9BURK|nr:SURF1 family protein [Variovorax ginsengisoli]MDP9900623.1 cytochrome oxidase assembly protein ShyY1 [Variovorax ginsengisoli]